jgi:hypothetical protein
MASAYISPDSNHACSYTLTYTSSSYSLLTRDRDLEYTTSHVTYLEYTTSHVTCYIFLARNYIHPLSQKDLRNLSDSNG